MSDFLMDSLKKLELPCNEEIVSRFDIYREMLKEWNEKVNLTAITDDRGIEIKHFIDSIVCYRYLDFNGKSLIDVGTGAGFPGLPLKIVVPDIKLTLLDSLQKRINFLCDVCEKMNFSDINLVHGRAEDIGQNKLYREKFDFAVSRAVAALPVLAEYCLPFVKIGGKFICFKGPDPKEEILESKKAIENLGGEIDDSMGYILPDMEITHTLIVIKKVRQTPTRFPRKAGTPQKSPIK